MMKFRDHPDHNRNIAVEFDDSTFKPTEHNKYVRGLPKEIVLYVNYQDPSPTGNSGKAIRLDNEVMHLLKAAPEMLKALEYAAKLIETARRYFPKSIKNSDRFQLENTCATIGKAIHNASKRTY
jgi:hypothetical protein